MIKKVWQTALVFYVLLMACIWFTPVAFSAVANHGFLSLLAIGITNSGGVLQVVVITAVTALVFALRNEQNTHVLFKFITQFFILFLLLASFALFNEFGIKKMAKISRPSHQYIFEHAGSTLSFDAFYELRIDERQEVLRKMVASSSYLRENIHPKVLDHWIDEAGYSFPSGHSFNAFLLSTVLSFSILRSRKLHWNNYYFVPYVWATAIAMSRVALGAHSPLDVSFGAILGIVIGTLLLYFETTRNFILHRKQIES